MASDSRKRFIKYQRAVDERQFYNFCELLPLEVDTELQLVFIINELQEVLHTDGDWQNLTGKYYAEKSLWFFHHQILLPEVEKFVASSLEEQDIELGVTIIAQWFQPRAVFTIEDIKHEFDMLAMLTKEALKTFNPEHPALSHKSVIAMKGKSLWNPEKCRQVVQALEMVIKPSFNKGFDSYYTPTNSYINMVLSKKEGIPITLCLTVMCIAKRLGLLLEPVNFPHHFILRWMEFPSKFGIERYTFIDVFGGRYSLTFQDLVDSFSMQTAPIVEAHCHRCTHQEILHRMLRNLLNLGGHQRTNNGLDLLHYSVELSNWFIPQDVELAILSAQVSLHLKINIPKTLSRIQEAAGSFNAHHHVLMDLQDQCQRLLLHLQRMKDKEVSPRPPKHRRENVQVMFAVGMVMKHKKYNYLCVIRGWDETCQASEQWIKQMNVDKCERGRMQPFYNVWVMDGSDRYAAEENLVFTHEAVMIKHPEVGRLFSEFTGRYYIPGPQLAADYPDDLKVTHDLVTRFFEDH
ncbi:unnamed protein product [Candidula unifasciata]|uniref:Hemimethylated DNA-binding domain-containing protein n=1 Tax=Candidula unifasciata TaxID=100452 RepID=A0A8S3Z090_9EUPU|nr:unnamed protein product [Candidula unifasciata]